MERRDAMTITRNYRRESRPLWTAAFSLVTLLALAPAASSQMLRRAHVEPASTELLYDNFVQDSKLNRNLWTTDSAFLTAIMNASDVPSPAFVPPKLVFDARKGGIEMSGPDENYQATGMQALSTFTPPFTVFMRVTPTSGLANAFEIFLASEDLTQYVTISCNINSGYIWANAPNVDLLWHFGEEFSPVVQGDVGTLYSIEIIVGATGEAKITIRNSNGVEMGSLSGLEAGGLGPFYLVLGQKIGSAPPTPLGANWFAVKVTTP
jgi:hypothetical protein